jgi:hypothetical protein
MMEWTLAQCGMMCGGQEQERLPLLLLAAAAAAAVAVTVTVTVAAGPLDASRQQRRGGKPQWSVARCRTSMGVKVTAGPWAEVVVMKLVQGNRRIKSGDAEGGTAMMAMEMWMGMGIGKCVAVRSTV